MKDLLLLSYTAPDEESAMLRRSLLAIVGSSNITNSPHAPAFSSTSTGASSGVAGMDGVTGKGLARLVERNLNLCTPPFNSKYKTTKPQVMLNQIDKIAIMSTNCVESTADSLLIV
ncbi:hypothetical protein ELY33_12250 [Vreelandella andesensis]|uniref:Uncharacterized protein n=1 Tax=Vreelandella andesensis TaxID=447567 RepID=A0A3S0XTP6_9GAMM|nr:hypothetical protein ELY33_12250 [Halomonas andesensis]